MPYDEKRHAGRHRTEPAGRTVRIHEHRSDSETPPRYGCERYWRQINAETAAGSRFNRANSSSVPTIPGADVRQKVDLSTFSDDEVLRLAENLRKGMPPIATPVFDGAKRSGNQRAAETGRPADFRSDHPFDGRVRVNSSNVR